MRLEELLFKDQCHLLTTEGSESPEPSNTKPDPPFLPVKVFVIIPDDIAQLGDISNVIVFMLMPVLMIQRNGPFCVN